MKNDLHEIKKQPSQPEPTAQAMLAAIAINTKTDAILKEMGVPTGEMDAECHRLTAEVIDERANIPMLLGALERSKAVQQTQLAFWEKSHASTKTDFAKNMAELCRLSIAIIDTATSLE